MSEAESFVTMAAEYWRAAQPLLPMYAHLILSAIFPIYTGAYASLSRPSSAAKRRKDDDPKQDDLEGEEDEEELVQKMEGLTASDAIIFPITAGLMLALLYYLITTYGARVINLILSWYFAAIGIYSVAMFLNDAASVLITLVFPNYYASKGTLFKVNSHRCRARAHGAVQTAELNAPSPVFRGKFLSATGWNLRSVLNQKYAVEIFVHSLIDIRAKLTAVNVVSAALGLSSVVYANLGGKPWWLTNLQGFAVCYSAMQLMSPTTFATGSLVLSALFFYDIWAVFFTPLMVTVATNLDQPIKLLFPKPEEPSLEPGKPPIQSYSMLGLGDIVLPGLMIGLALRFDLYMHYLKKQTTVKSSTETSEGDKSSVKKAKYVPITGRWGDYFWTLGLKKSATPETFQLVFAKPYFVMSLVGYLIGMLTTLAVMTVFQHAQPALLYLVPGVLISIWSTALVRSELSQMWNFSEAITGEQLDETDDAKPEKKETKANVKEQERSSSELPWWQRLWRGLFESEPDNTKEDSDKVDSKTKVESSQAIKHKTDGTIVSFSISRVQHQKAASTKAKPH